MIEGDNLEAMTTLAYTHEEKIDVIYNMDVAHRVKVYVFSPSEDFWDVRSRRSAKKWNCMRCHR